MTVVMQQSEQLNIWSECAVDILYRTEIRRKQLTKFWLGDENFVKRQTYAHYFSNKKLPFSIIIYVTV